MNLWSERISQTDSVVSYKQNNNIRQTEVGLLIKNNQPLTPGKGIVTAVVVTLIGLFCVNIMGFIDTYTQSAYGCGHEWPLCNGAVIPSHWGLHTKIEFAHRGIVGVMTLLLLIVSVILWVRYHAWKEIRILILGTLSFVFLEALLGAAGVLFSDPPAVLASHFGISLLAFDGVFLLVIVTLQLRKNLRRGKLLSESRGPFPLRSPLPDYRLRKWVFFTLFYVYLEMYIGAYIASTHSGYVFRGWPFPKESYAEYHLAFILDCIHRSMALGLLLLLVFIFLRALRIRNTRPDLFYGSITALILVLLQAASGFLLIATHLRLSAYVIHVSLISLLFAMLGYLGLQTLPQMEKIKSAELTTCRIEV